MANDFAAVLSDPTFGSNSPQYDKFVQLASRLITEKGRDIEIIRDTAAGLVDPTKPHLGKKQRSSTIVTKGVFDQPSVFQNFSQTTDDDLIKQSTWSVWIAALGLPAAPSIKDKVRTLGSRYQIVDQVSIAPGNEPVIFLALLKLV
jgi:hypothetical protein